MLSIFFLNLVGHSQKEAIIYWDKDQKLTWQDFQGKIIDSISNDGAAAKCYSEIIFQYDQIEGHLNCTTFARFYKLISYVRDTLYLNASSYYVTSTSIKILGHEQLHFDICELYTRLIREQFQILKEKHIENINEYLGTFKKFYYEFNQLQDLYDMETRHGENPEKQLEWFNNINKRLDSLGSYYLKYSGQLDD
jgi:hypothetical protein